MYTLAKENLPLNHLEILRKKNIIKYILTYRKTASCGVWILLYLSLRDLCIYQQIINNG